MDGIVLAYSHFIYFFFTPFMFVSDGKRLKRQKKNIDNVSIRLKSLF